MSFKFSLLAALLTACVSPVALAADLGGKGKKTVVVAAPTEEATSPDDSYGFIDSSNAGKAGDKGLSFENNFRWNKADGRYFVNNFKLEYGYTPIDRLQLTLALWGAHHAFNAVSVMNGVERNKVMFDGVGGGLKYQFIERDAGPLGLGLSTNISARWSRISEGAGLEANRYSFGWAMQADKTLIKDKLFMALNFSASTGQEKIFGQPTTTDSGYEVGGALSYKLLDNLFVGVNARYATAYTGQMFNGKVGNAIFVGPTANLTLPGGWSIVAAWTPQVWGHDLTGASPARTDLSAFERHQARLRISKSF